MGKNLSKPVKIRISQLIALAAMVINKNVLGWFLPIFVKKKKKIFERSANVLRKPSHIMFLIKNRRSVDPDTLIEYNCPEFRNGLLDSYFFKLTSKFSFSKFSVVNTLTNFLILLQL